MIRAQFKFIIKPTNYSLAIVFSSSFNRPFPLARTGWTLAIGRRKWHVLGLSWSEFLWP